MSSIEEFDKNSDTQCDDLFQKSLYENNWDDIPTEKPSIVSLSPDEISRMVCQQNKFANRSDNNGYGNKIRDQLPGMVSYEPMVNRFHQYSPSDTTFTEDSLEPTDMKISESGDDDLQEMQGSFFISDAKTTEQELNDKESCEKEEGNPVDYMDKEVFPVLLPCLEKMLFAAKEHDVLKIQKSHFNGLDYLAELLWNCNPLHPERQGSYVSIFDIPFVQKHLEENPRPAMPQSWVWTREQAAVVIQAAVRGYLVRRLPGVQEMRQFWRTLAGEKRQDNLPQTVLGLGEDDASNKSTGIKIVESNISFYSQYLNENS